MTDPTTRMMLSGIQNHRWAMKSKTRPGLKNSISELRTDAESLDLGAADPPIEDEACAEDAREEAAEDAHPQRDREALDRAAAVLHQDQRRDEHRRVAVDDRRQGARVAGVDRRARGLPRAELFANALVDEDVRVDAHAD